MGSCSMAGICMKESSKLILKARGDNCRQRHRSLRAAQWRAHSWHCVVQAMAAKHISQWSLGPGPNQRKKIRITYNPITYPCMSTSFLAFQGNPSFYYPNNDLFLHGCRKFLCLKFYATFFFHLILHLWTISKLMYITVFYSFFLLYIVFHQTSTISFIFSPISGHLGCFWLLLIINNAAMNNFVHISAVSVKDYPYSKW